MTAGIYALRNTRTGVTYIGSTVDLDHRWRAHQYALARGAHYNPRLQQAWNEDGPAAFAFELLEALPSDSRTLGEAEMRWYARLQAQGIGLFGNPRLRRPARVGATRTRGPALRYWRMERGLIQKVLAERAGVDRATVARLEQGGQARLDTISKIAVALGISPGDLQRQPPTQ
jgi:DNA-binding Xre family transcriptional regulator